MKALLRWSSSLQKVSRFSINTFNFVRRRVLNTRTCGDTFPGVAEPGGVCDGETSLVDGVRVGVLRGVLSLLLTRGWGLIGMKMMFPGRGWCGGSPGSETKCKIREGWWMNIRGTDPWSHIFCNPQPVLSFASSTQSAHLQEISAKTRHDNHLRWQSECSCSCTDSPNWCQTQIENLAVDRSVPISVKVTKSPTKEQLPIDINECVVALEKLLYSGTRCNQVWRGGRHGWTGGLCLCLFTLLFALLKQVSASQAPPFTTKTWQFYHMAPDINTLPKRGPGRPKGSKNTVTKANLVRRPRKNRLVTSKNSSTGHVGKYYLMFMNRPNWQEFQTVPLILIDNPLRSTHAFPQATNGQTTNTRVICIVRHTIPYWPPIYTTSVTVSPAADHDQSQCRIKYCKARIGWHITLHPNHTQCFPEQCERE